MPNSVRLATRRLSVKFRKKFSDTLSISIDNSDSDKPSANEESKSSESTDNPNQIKIDQPKEIPSRRFSLFQTARKNSQLGKKGKLGHGLFGKRAFSLALSEPSSELLKEEKEEENCSDLKELNVDLPSLVTKETEGDQKEIGLVKSDIVDLSLDDLNETHKKIDGPKSFPSQNHIEPGRI